MDLPIAAALIGAIIGAVSAAVTSFIAIRKLSIELEQVKATTAATWTSAQAVVITSLRDENRELRARLDTYEEAIKILQTRDRELQNQIRDLVQKNKWLVRENAVLRNALQDAGIDVPEFVVQK